MGGMSVHQGTRDRRGWLLGAVALLALAVIALWWSQNFERKQIEVPMPPRGEAAFNPLYALKRALLLDGVDARSRRRLALAEMAPAPRDTLWLLGDVRALPARDAAGLVAWIEQGGHLIVDVPTSWRSDRKDVGPLLRALGVAINEADGGCAEFSGGSVVRDVKEPNVQLCGGLRMDVALGTAVLARWHNAEGADLLLRLRHGAGSFDLVSGLDFANNAGLSQPAAAALARQLLAPNYGRGTVHLVYEAEMPPLWRLLLERGWMAWLPLALATLGWLWWRTQRRGPLLPPPPLTRRSLLEHVQASGEHIHRYGRGHLLHASLRQAFDARLRRRDPYAASLTGAAQRAAIAARTGLPEAEVEAALRAPVPFVAADLRLRIAKLNRLRHRL
jgi:hypothetical protein